MASAVETVPDKKTDTPSAAQPQTVALTPPRERAPVQYDPSDPLSLWMDLGSFEHIQRIAGVLAKSELVPAHFRGKVADCFLVVAQAFRWGMDPFAVLSHTFVLSGKLGYEGKVIAALINTSGKTEGNLRPTYTGTPGTPQRGVVISARLKGETQDRTVEGTVAGWQTQNAKWKEIPDQMLVYRGAREWARRHMPEVMLGVTADEELVAEPLVRVDGGTRVVPALEILTDGLAAQQGTATTGANASTGGAGAESAGETVTEGAAPETCEAGTRVAAEGERCDHQILLTDDCPSCLLETKKAAAASDTPKPGADTKGPFENPFLKKQKEAAAKEEEKRAAGRRSAGDK